jgi:hypothetical protein
MFWVPREDGDDPVDSNRVQVEARVNTDVPDTTRTAINVLNRVRGALLTRPRGPGAPLLPVQATPDLDRDLELLDRICNNRLNPAHPNLTMFARTLVWRPEKRGGANDTGNSPLDVKELIDGLSEEQCDLLDELFGLALGMLDCIDNAQDKTSMKETFKHFVTNCGKDSAQNCDDLIRAVVAAANAFANAVGEAKLSERTQDGNCAPPTDEVAWNTKETLEGRLTRPLEDLAKKLQPTDALGDFRNALETYLAYVQCLEECCKKRSEPTVAAEDSVVPAHTVVPAAAREQIAAAEETVTRRTLEQPGNIDRHASAPAQPGSVPVQQVREVASAPARVIGPLPVPPVVPEVVPPVVSAERPDDLAGEFGNGGNVQRNPVDMRRPNPVRGRSIDPDNDLGNWPRADGNAPVVSVNPVQGASSPISTNPLDPRDIHLPGSSPRSTNPVGTPVQEAAAEETGDPDTDNPRRSASLPMSDGTPVQEAAAEETGETDADNPRRSASLPMSDGTPVQEAAAEETGETDADNPRRSASLPISDGTPVQEAAAEETGETDADNPRRSASLPMSDGTPVQEAAAEETGETDADNPRRSASLPISDGTPVQEAAAEETGETDADNPRRSASLPMSDGTPVQEAAAEETGETDADNLRRQAIAPVQLPQSDQVNPGGEGDPPIDEFGVRQGRSHSAPAGLTPASEGDDGLMRPRSSTGSELSTPLALRDYTLPIFRSSSGSESVQAQSESDSHILRMESAPADLQYLSPDPPGALSRRLSNPGLAGRSPVGTIPSGWSSSSSVSSLSSVPEEGSGSYRASTFDNPLFDVGDLRRNSDPGHQTPIDARRQRIMSYPGDGRVLQGVQPAAQVLRSSDRGDGPVQPQGQRQTSLNRVLQGVQPAAQVLSDRGDGPVPAGAAVQGNSLAGRRNSYPGYQGSPRPPPQQTSASSTQLLRVELNQLPNIELLVKNQQTLNGLQVKNSGKPGESQLEPQTSWKIGVYDGSPDEGRIGSTGVLKVFGNVSEKPRVFSTNVMMLADPDTGELLHLDGGNLLPENKRLYIGSESNKSNIKILADIGGSLSAQIQDLPPTDLTDLLSILQQFQTDDERVLGSLILFQDGNIMVLVPRPDMRLSIKLPLKLWLLANGVLKSMTNTNFSNTNEQEAPRRFLESWRRNEELTAPAAGSLAYLTDGEEVVVAPAGQNPNFIRSDRGTGDSSAGAEIEEILDARQPVPGTDSLQPWQLVEDDEEGEVPEGTTILQRAAAQPSTSAAPAGQSPGDSSAGAVQDPGRPSDTAGSQPRRTGPNWPLLTGPQDLSRTESTTTDSSTPLGTTTQEAQHSKVVLEQSTEDLDYTWLVPPRGQPDTAVVYAERGLEPQPPVATFKLQEDGSAKLISGQGISSDLFWEIEDASESDNNDNSDDDTVVASTIVPASNGGRKLRLKLKLKQKQSPRRVGVRGLSDLLRPPSTVSGIGVNATRYRLKGENGNNTIDVEVANTIEAEGPGTRALSKESLGPQGTTSVPRVPRNSSTEESDLDFEMLKPPGTPALRNKAEGDGDGADDPLPSNSELVVTDNDGGYEVLLALPPTSGGVPTLKMLVPKLQKNINSANVRAWKIDGTGKASPATQETEKILPKDMKGLRVTFKVLKQGEGVPASSGALATTVLDDPITKQQVLASLVPDDTQDDELEFGGLPEWLKTYLTKKNGLVLKGEAEEHLCFLSDDLDFSGPLGLPQSQGGPSSSSTRPQGPPPTPSQPPSSDSYIGLSVPPVGFRSLTAEQVALAQARQSQPPQGPPGRLDDAAEEVRWRSNQLFDTPEDQIEDNRRRNAVFETSEDDLDYTWLVPPRGQPGIVVYAERGLESKPPVATFELQEDGRAKLISEQGISSDLFWEIEDATQADNSDDTVVASTIVPASDGGTKLRLKLKQKQSLLRVGADKVRGLRDLLRPPSTVDRGIGVNATRYRLKGENGNNTIDVEVANTIEAEGTIDTEVEKLEDAAEEESELDFDMLQPPGTPALRNKAEGDGDDLDFSGPSGGPPQALPPKTTGIALLSKVANALASNNNNVEVAADEDGDSQAGDVLSLTMPPDSGLPQSLEMKKPRKYQLQANVKAMVVGPDGTAYPGNKQTALAQGATSGFRLTFDDAYKGKAVASKPFFDNDDEEVAVTAHLVPTNEGETADPLDFGKLPEFVTDYLIKNPGIIMKSTNSGGPDHLCFFLEAPGQSLDDGDVDDVVLGMAPRTAQLQPGNKANFKPVGAQLLVDNANAAQKPPLPPGFPQQSASAQLQGPPPLPPSAPPSSSSSYIRPPQQQPPPNPESLNDSGINFSLQPPRPPPNPESSVFSQPFPPFAPVEASTEDLSTQQLAELIRKKSALTKEVNEYLAKWGSL